MLILLYVENFFGLKTLVSVSKIEKKNIKE